ncbi:DNA polymerase Y family protein [Thioalkalivibrio sp. XN279]|uniref:Y-family DNA polymerase n=1 Tax=Thioalkalivibrio sp. XN279 TaxID=2714953 RepID=UPI001409AAC0|nr:DNA polymerase Y family protein [Thioalkalivibrio sp. XN279]NHA14309.1 DNA polymerase Y family protein [Thioalkalivibrio sp. XN279]
MRQAAAQARPAMSGAPDAPSASAGDDRARPAPLWLCLGLPRLPLEVRAAGREAHEPCVLVGSDGRVVQAGEAAAEAGVAPGLPLNAALALCPGMVVLARDEAAEAAALARLAAWAGAFTSMVSLEPPAALLLEVRGSLRLFGGLEPLRHRLRRALARTGHAGRDAVAPTPLAALWLARAGEREAVTEPAALAGRLGRLRPAVTAWPQATLEKLQSLGVETLADCLRLPRDGFARRVGRGPLADLDRALGRLADPRPAFRLPPRYRAEVELAAETGDTARLQQVAEGLFAELEGFLRACQRAVTRIVVRFRHLGRAPSALGIGLAAPGLEAARFGALFAARLERLALPAPVIALSVEAEPGEALIPVRVGLFGDEPGSEAGLQLVERLRARLGREAVQGLALGDDHRPEASWVVREPGSGAWPAVDSRAAAATRAGALAAALPRAARPSWLLDPPQRLRSRGGRPWHEGELVLERGPERIETGWWDGQGIARDYWVARTPAGARLWVFRQRPDAADVRPQWFLHGVFG